ncbi:MAG: manganese efflux pump MntP family protein [Acidobacteriia bacterium]|nr:manganese efflux pump MntP family protein [Terriglobia bacterium]
MTLLEVILLALALSADAFSVALVVGLRFSAPRQLFRLSWHFGLFQALMPVVGAAGGVALRELLHGTDRYVAFGVLAALGARMFWESLRHAGPFRATPDPTRGLSLVGLSLATSLDALGVGVGLALARANLPRACAIIGITAGLATLVGMLLGAKVGHAAGRLAGALGGLVIAGLGIKMLFP